METQVKRKLSKEIIRNLFKTILLPLYNGLLNVDRLLQTGNLSFESYCRNFVEIKNFLGFVHIRYSLNYEILTAKLYGELLDFNSMYDEKFNELNNYSNQLFELLTDSKEFRDLFLEKIAEYEANGSISNSDCDYIRKTNSIQWIAILIINDIKELPKTHTLHPLWNNESQKFYEFTKKSDFKEIYYKLLESKVEFRAIVNFIIDKLKNEMIRISLEYGVPIVEESN